MLVFQVEVNKPSTWLAISVAVLPLALLRSICLRVVVCTDACQGSYAFAVS